MDAPPQTLAPVVAPPKALTYKVGTLSYTRATLFTVFFWMLWGDLFLQIFEAVINSMLALQLKWLGTSDTLIGLITGTLPALLAFGLSPIIGMQSDRHRGKFGRRRPFLLWCTPGLVLCLILLAYAAPLASWLFGLLENVSWITPSGVTIALIALFCIGLYTFNNYIVQLYQFLFADVIPQEVMGTFIGFYRAVGAVSGFVFNRWILGHARDHLTLIYTSSALLFGLAFMLLIWRVKEGDYPPPAPAPERTGPIQFVRRYAVECFSHTFYLKVYCVALFFWCASGSFGTFIVFFATRVEAVGYAPTLGLTLDAFGKVKAWTLAVQIPMFLLSGLLVDRFHPLRVVVVSFAGIAATYLAGFFFVHGGTSFLVMWIANQVATASFLGGYAAMYPRLLPRERYGQYFTANQIFFSSGLMVAPALCGWVLDAVKDYRFLFLWSGTLAALGSIMAVAAYRHWLRLGGDRDYVAPLPAATSAPAIGVS